MHSMPGLLKKISISVGRTLLTDPRSFRIIGDANRVHPDMDATGERCWSKSLCYAGNLTVRIVKDERYGIKSWLNC